MVPGVRLVIDIGGQDSKAITVDTEGLVEDFAMNDRCASGTGRFYEVLARALECELDDLGPLAMQGGEDLEVSGMCATFAETEIVSLLAQGMPPQDVASSVHRAIAGRTLALVAQVGRRTPVVLTGGVARNPAAVHFLTEALGVDVLVPEHPQITGAFGAALLAMESATRAGAGSGADRAAAVQRQDVAISEPSRPLRPPVDNRLTAHVATSEHSCGDCDGTRSAMVTMGSTIPVHGR